VYLPNLRAHPVRGDSSAVGDREHTVARRTLPGFGQAWIPGPGMLLVLISGAVAAVVAVQLLPVIAQGTRSSPGPRATR
jgi:hypothetical protein